MSIKKMVNATMILAMVFSAVSPGLGGFVNVANAEEVEKATSAEAERNVSLLNVVEKTKTEKNKINLPDRKYGVDLIAGKKNYVDGEIIVKYKSNKINLDTYSGRTKALNFNRVKLLEKKEDLRKNNISVLRIKDSKTVEQKIAELKNDPNVEYVQPNFQYYPADIDTNDMNKGLLWGLDNTGQTVGGTDPVHAGIVDADVDAPEAWAIGETTASTSIIVAVIDTGVAYNHPDLLANMWDGTNCKDENGAVIAGGCNHGYDYKDNDKTPLPTTSSHGTHIAGTIAAAKGNGLGIIGVAPNAKIMAIKSSLTTSDNVKSINFAKQNGAKIINASWLCYGSNQGGTHAVCGTPDYDDQAMIDAIASFPGLFVTAAGNGDGDTDITGDDHDNGQILRSYPCDHTANNIICVAATDQNDALASFSDYGVTSVDVGAPGTNIYSTVPSINDAISLNESFESVAEFAVPIGWTQNGFWGVFDMTPYWGSAWGKVLYGDLNYPYLNNANTITMAPTINLSGATSGFIDFWAKCDTEYITNGWADYMQLEYSSDGINFLPAIDPYFGGKFRWDEPTLDILSGENPLNSTGNSVFHYENVSIPSQYLTSNFKLRFRWVTNASDNSYNGCLVDDMRVIKRVVSNGSDEKYGYADGTSMAAPYVAGLVALIEGYNSNLTSSQVKNIILNSGDDITALHGKTFAGTRINAQKALEAANPAKAITGFTIPDQLDTTIINETDHTIAVTVPFGTVVNALVPNVVITGASISPLSGTPQNFTGPVIFIVTAADSSIQAYVVTVTLAPATTHTISGTIKYYDGVKVIPNSIIKLETDLGVLVATTTTDSGGHYQFTQIPTGGNYVVSVGKADNSATNGVSASDLIKIRRHITSLEIFDSVYKVSAADINNSNSLSASDLIKIRRYVTILEIPPITWRFYDSDFALTISNYLTDGQKRVYTNLIADLVGQDFVGVKLGDVNNSWVSQ